MYKQLYNEEHLLFINAIIKSFRLYNVNLTENQAYLAYHNYSKDKFNLDWSKNSIKYSSHQGIVSKLKDYIPENKLRYLK